MSERIVRDWFVLDSIENGEHDRCVDVFRRPDGAHGFEEFPRDVEDQGTWTPVQFYSGLLFADRAAALKAAKGQIAWLAQALTTRNPKNG